MMSKDWRKEITRSRKLRKSIETKLPVRLTAAQKDHLLDWIAENLDLVRRPFILPFALPFIVPLFPFFLLRGVRIAARGRGDLSCAIGARWVHCVAHCGVAWPPVSATELSRAPLRRLFVSFCPALYWRVTLA